MRRSRFRRSTTQKSFLARVDAVLSPKDQLTVRGSRWDSDNPFNLGGGGYPSTASALDRYATNVLGTWSRVISDNIVQQVQSSDTTTSFSVRRRWPASPARRNSTFPGLTIGAPYNLPSIEWQREFEARYELNWHKDNARREVRRRIPPRRSHRLLGHPGERPVHDVVDPAEPGGAASGEQRPFAPSTWNLAALNPYVLFYNQNFNQSGWQINVPRPEAALWFGDNWHARTG